MSPALPALEIRDSASDCRTVRIDREITRLGRRSDNDIQILESHVSKRHADILRRGEQFVIVDAGSKAGVFVNGARVSERVLADGDVITLGATALPTLVFRRDGSAPAKPASASLFATLTGPPGEQGLENLARFLEFNRLMGGRFTLAEILENVVDMAAELTGAERGFLILRGPGASLEHRVARGRDRVAIPLDEIRVSETIVREVLAKGTARIVSDVRDEEDLVEMRSVVSLDLRSAVALPLRRFEILEGAGPRAEAGDEVFGVLYLDSRERHGAFSRIDRGILENLARDASSVIENARLSREAEEKRRIEEEMERAREIQAALIPQEFWGDDHFEASGCCVPCLHLGGDYLDQYRLPGGRCGFVIADVSGKGMPAALLAAALQGILAAETVADPPPGAMVERINRALCRLAPAGKFVTLFCCVLSPAGDLAYVNAGHCPPMVVTAGGEVRQLSSGDMALGVRESNRYREDLLRLRAGDVVALYTDGVTEAANADGEFFEEPRLESVLRDSFRLPAGEIVRAVRGAVEAFSGGAPPRDDITLMALKYLGR
jgi:serine phosphatase RsbU (regulator of sigma subunit)